MARFWFVFGSFLVSFWFVLWFVLVRFWFVLWFVFAGFTSFTNFLIVYSKNWLLLLSSTAKFWSCKMISKKLTKNALKDLVFGVFFFSFPCNSNSNSNQLQSLIKENNKRNSWKFYLKFQKRPKTISRVNMNYVNNK